MAYNNTYSATDIGPATIDLIVSIISMLVGFGSLIGLVLLWRWMKGRSTF